MCPCLVFLCSTSEGTKVVQAKSWSFIWLWWEASFISFWRISCWIFRGSLTASRFLLAFTKLSNNLSYFQVYVHNLVTEHGLISRSSEFEAAIQNGDRSALKLLCEKKSQESEYVFYILPLVASICILFNMA